MPRGITARDSRARTCWPALRYATSVSDPTCAARMGTSTNRPSWASSPGTRRGPYSHNRLGSGGCFPAARQFEGAGNRSCQGEQRQGCQGKCHQRDQVADGLVGKSQDDQRRRERERADLQCACKPHAHESAVVAIRKVEGRGSSQQRGEWRDEVAARRAAEEELGGGVGNRQRERAHDGRGDTADADGGEEIGLRGGVSLPRGERQVPRQASHEPDHDDGEDEAHALLDQRV